MLYIRKGHTCGYLQRHLRTLQTVMKIDIDMTHGAVTRTDSCLENMSLQVLRIYMFMLHVLDNRKSLLICLLYIFYIPKNSKYLFLLSQAWYLVHCQQTVTSLMSTMWGGMNPTDLSQINKCPSWFPEWLFDVTTCVQKKNTKERERNNKCVWWSRTASSWRMNDVAARCVCVAS